ncbi:MAG: hypothetical protein H7Y03_06650, partial [Chitinophagaceae bacterium]|nr:hypothetical protein [Chitinophagaceae bacterium]
MATRFKEINADDMVDGSTNKVVTTAEKTTWNAKADADQANIFTQPQTVPNITVTDLNDATGVAKMVTVNNGVLGYQAIPGGGGGGDALVANPLSQFAVTTSLQLKGVISDETGSGALVFA